MIQEKEDKSSEVDFKSLVRLALDQKVSWTKLKSFLDDLASTFETAKKLNEVLLDEIQALHAKTINDPTQETDKTEPEEQEIDENGSEDDVMVLFTKQETIDDKLNFIADNEVEKSSEDFHDFVDNSLSLENIQTNGEEELQLGNNISINKHAETTGDAKILKRILLTILLMMNLHFLRMKLRL